MGLKSGFTLLESTIVIGIVSLLLTIGANLFVFSKQAARDAVRKTDIEQIRAALEFYKEEDTNRYYPALLTGLSNTYMDKIPQDPLINTQYEYCYSLNPDTDPTNYILAVELERGGPSSCNCGNLSYNYCFTPYGVLLNPTPTIAPVTQPPQSTNPPATNTPPATTLTPTATATPTAVPPITCNQHGSAYFDGQKYIVTLISNYTDASWTVLNNLNCTPLAGSGSIFGTSCVNIGTSTATVSFGGIQNTCQFSTSQ